MMYYILWPIKWLLQERVERYERELKVIYSRRDMIAIKARQSGFTTHNANCVMKDLVMVFKYTNFIKKWKL